jgi:hypothetical protein
MDLTLAAIGIFNESNDNHPFLHGALDWLDAVPSKKNPVILSKTIFHPPRR